MTSRQTTIKLGSNETESFWVLVDKDGKALLHRGGFDSQATAKADCRDCAYLLAGNLLFEDLTDEQPSGPDTSTPFGKIVRETIDKVAEGIADAVVDDAEKAEKKRIADEDKAEKKRTADAAAADAERAERNRIAAEEKAEKKRVADEEKAEKKRIAAEKKAEKKRKKKEHEES